MPELQGGSIPGVMEVTPAQLEEPNAQQNSASTNSPTTTNSPSQKGIRHRIKNPFSRTNPKESQTNKTPGIKVSHSEARTDIASLPNVDKGGRHRTEGTKTPESYEVSGDVVKGFEGFAAGYMQKLILMEKDVQNEATTGHRDTYEEMKSYQGSRPDLGPIHAEDNALRELFTQVDETTGERVLKSTDEIGRLIREHPEVRQAVMISAEMYASEAFAAAGLRANIEGRGQRSSGQNLERTIDLAEGQGSINKVARRVSEFARTPTNANGRGEPGMSRGRAITIGAVGTTEVAAAGFVIGSLAGGVGGPAGAATALGAEAVAAVIARSSRNGVRINLTRDETSQMRSMQPENLTRSWALLGINPENLGSSESLDRTLEEAIQIMYLRAEYLTDLGVPANKLDTLTDEFLTRDDQAAEQLGEPVRTLIRRNYGRKLTETPPPADLTQRQSLQRDLYRQSQSEVITRGLANVLKKENARTEVDRATILGEAITDVENGRTTGETVRAATKEKGLLTSDRTSVEGSLANLDTYAASVRAAGEKDRELDIILRRIREENATNPFGDFDTTIDRLHAQITRAGAQILFVPGENGRLIPIPSLADKSNDVRAEISTAKQAITQGANESDDSFRDRRRDESRRIDEQHQPTLDRIASQRQIVEAAIERLENLKREAESARNDVASSVDAQAARTIFDELNQARAAIGPNLPNTLDFGDAMRAANAAGLWPESENENADHRTTINNALIQARTNIYLLDNALNPNYQRNETSFNAIVNPQDSAHRLTEEQLRAFDIDRLKSELSARGVNVDQVAVFNLLNAKAWAEAKLEFTQRALRDQQSTIQIQENQQQRIIDSADNSLALDRLKLTKEIIENSDTAHARTMESYIQTGQDSNLESTAQATATREGYTQAEQDRGLPENILEYLNILTGYQEKANRSEEFQRIMRDFENNDILINFLRQSFDEEIPPAAAPNINSFSQELAERKRNGSLTMSGFKRSVDKSMDVLFNWRSV